METTLRRHGRYEAFIRRASAAPPMRTAVVHPCSADILRSARHLKEKNLLTPVLVGPEHKILAIAHADDIQVDDMEIVAAEQVIHANARAVRDRSSIPPPHLVKVLFLRGRET